MFEQLELPGDMLETIKSLYENTKKYDPHLTEYIFLQVIIDQWLRLYLSNVNQEQLHKDKIVLKNDLKIAIQLSGKTQRQIAQETGINYTYLSQVIHGKYEPSITVVLLLVKALNYPSIKINELFFLEPAPEV